MSVRLSYPKRCLTHFVRAPCCWHALETTRVQDVIYLDGPQTVSICRPGCRHPLRHLGACNLSRLFPDAFEEAVPHYFMS